MIYGNIIAEGRIKNSLFDTDDRVHRYNPTHMPRLLREAFLAQGIEINTPDVNQGRSVAFDLHLEGKEFVEDGTAKYLIALENPSLNHLNADRDYCKRFTKVFAWDARLLDLPNVVKVLVPNQILTEPFPSYAERDIFSCLINANKAFREAITDDLYRERINTIRWYEKHALDKFELYGMGWEKPTPAFDLKGKIKRSLSSLRAKHFDYKPFPSYRGEIRDKNSIMRRSKYSYCYENTQGPNNYITEKIFDSFLSGCVPVYWGPDNVLKYIPEDCFVDRRNFKDTAAVHNFLLSISPEEYARYQSNIAGFLAADAAKIFSVEYFVSLVSEQISSDVLKEVSNGKKTVVNFKES